MQKPSCCLLGCKLTSQAALSESSFPDTCCHPSIQPWSKLMETGGRRSQLAAGVSAGHQCQPETQPIRASFRTLALQVGSKGYKTQVNKGESAGSPSRGDERKQAHTRNGIVCYTPNLLKLKLAIHTPTYLHAEHIRLVVDYHKSKTHASLPHCIGKTPFCRFTSSIHSWHINPSLHVLP